MLITNKHYRQNLKNKKRIVIKVGSSSLVHPETGETDLLKLEQLVRVLCDLRNQGKDVVLVSSGAIGVGRKALGLNERPKELAQKQACASVGQGMLMMIYQKLFNEYSHVASQILMTKHTIVREKSLHNARNTFNELLRMGVIPIVNENDTVSVAEFGIGDNDTLSAIVATSVHADLLVLLSDIDGLYTADPHKNPDAARIELVPEITEEILRLADGKGSELGTGGMKTKLTAAQIVTKAGTDMIIANGAEVEKLYALLDGKSIGTRFLGKKADI